MKHLFSCQVSEERISDFKKHLISEEKSANTVEKYIRDARAFAAFAGERAVTKELAVAYKQALTEKRYEVNSVNSMLASINSLFAFLGWHDCKVKAIKRQRQIFCGEDKEPTKAEYIRLLNAAKQKKNDRLNLILQTICGTGIRVSELEFITVEAAKAGQAMVNRKGKTRAVFLVKELRNCTEINCTFLLALLVLCCVVVNRRAQSPPQSSALPKTSHSAYKCTIYFCTVPKLTA